MKVEVVSIGDELLLAKILDINASYLTRCLRELEITLTARVIVGDQPGPIAEVLRAGLERADVVICSGGLGKHDNDYTRQAVSQLARSERAPAQPGFGEGTALGPPTSAQGLLLETEKTTLICLPGDQRELSYLVQTEVLPYLQRRLLGEDVVGWVVFRTAGIMESNVRELLAGLPLQTGQQLTYTSYAGQTDVRLLVRAAAEKAVRAGLARLTTEIETRLGDHIYGRDRDRLEQVTVQQLQRHTLQVALAEHDTGNATAQMVQTVPGAGNTFTLLSLTTYEGISRYLKIEMRDDAADLTRWCRLVSERLRQKMATDLGLVVYKKMTPGGMQLLVTLTSANGISVTQRSFGGHPENINQWAGTLGLVHLRRWLLTHYPESER